MPKKRNSKVSPQARLNTIHAVLDMLKTRGEILLELLDEPMIYEVTEGKYKDIFSVTIGEDGKKYLKKNGPTTFSTRSPKPTYHRLQPCIRQN